MVAQEMEIHKREGLQSLAIVIINYNGTQWFKKFLPGVIKFTPNASFYIIDNASTDDSVQYIRNNFPQINIIQNSYNYGYAEGYNIGLKQIEEDIYCLLNSDVEVSENWVDPVLQLFSQQENISAVQPKILNYNNKNLFEFSGAGGGFIDNLCYPFCRGRVFFDTEEDLGQYNDIHEIFWASGACLFIRKDDFRKQNGFDSDFFAHMEEIDLCWRLKNEGKKIMYCGLSKVYHVGGGTLNPYDPQKTYLNFRNNLLMLIKNLPADKVFPIFFFRLILDGLAGINFIFSNGWKYCFAVIKAHFSVYRLLFKFIRKRKAGINDYYEKKYIVFQYFLRKRKKFDILR